MDSQAYINALGHALGQDFALDQYGTLTLAIDDVPLLIQERADHFHMQMPIGAITAVDKLSVMTELLSANFLLHQTGGGALSYNAEAGAVFLEYAMHTEQMDAESFVAAVEAFVHMVDAWMTRLDEINASAARRVAQKIAELEAKQAENEALRTGAAGQEDGMPEGAPDQKDGDAEDGDAEDGDVLTIPKSTYLQI